MMTAESRHLHNARRDLRRTEQHPDCYRVGKREPLCLKQRSRCTVIMVTARPEATRTDCRTPAADWVRTA